MNFFNKFFKATSDTNTITTKKSDSASTSSSEPVFLGMQGGNTTPSKYEVYRATDAEVAKTFLLAKKVTKDQYYIIVETPQGNWGMDKLGLYLEHLLPWQSDISLAQIEVANITPSNLASLEMAARGINDNFIANLECGHCKNGWVDGIKYSGISVVSCPKCKKFNKVDSSNCIVKFF